MGNHYHWGYVAFYAIVHTIGIYGLISAGGASAAVIIFTVAYFFFGHLSITCGAHRLYSHESYVASRFLQYVWNLGFSAVAQGPLVWWVGKHRHHHAQTDRDGDPHSPMHGFFHAHMGWLLKRDHITPAPRMYVAHLWRDHGETFAPALWQLRNASWLIPLMAAGVPIMVGILAGDLWGGVVIGVFTRLMLQYHFTWVVNSVGHSFGTSRGSSATNVWVLAIPTVGESFHANHHERPSSYRLGRAWYDIDLGYYAIALCMKLGLARERKE